MRPWISRSTCDASSPPHFCGHCDAALSTSLGTPGCFLRQLALSRRPEQTPMGTGPAREASSVGRNPLNRTDPPILDYLCPGVRRFTEAVRPADDSELGFLRAAHGLVATAIHPIYTLRERQPVSRTILLRRGSCSQRMACLEAVARTVGVGTRVRALWVSGHFWNNRFPLMRLCIPSRVLLAWPQFH